MDLGRRMRERGGKLRLIPVLKYLTHGEVLQKTGKQLVLLLQ
jgi:hypothetical protein